MKHVTSPGSITRLARFVFECIQIHSLQHPEVFVGIVNGVWAGRLRIHGPTASCSLTRYIGTQPEQICFLLAAVFISILLQLISALQD